MDKSKNLDIEVQQQQQQRQQQPQPQVAAAADDPYQEASDPPILDVNLNHDKA
jgi:hypothetical protein